MCLSRTQSRTQLRRYERACRVNDNKISIYESVLSLFSFSDPCDSATCFPNSQCFVQNGAPFCRCIPGFQLSASRKSCIDIDECQGNPCGDNAICENIVGSFLCKCPSGASGDPSKKCSGGLTLRCSSDSACKDGETCISGR